MLVRKFLAAPSSSERTAVKRAIMINTSLSRMPGPCGFADLRHAHRPASVSDDALA
jgi:hypothetical protein